MAAVFFLLGCSDAIPSAPADRLSESPQATDAASVAPSTIKVEKGVFDVTYRLDGAVEQSASVGLDVPPGTSLRSEATTGADVTVGAALATVEPTAPSEAPRGTVDKSQVQLAQARKGVLVAPVSGRMTVSPSSVQIDNLGLDVVVPLRPLQELRYRALGFTGSASVETTLGTRDAPCVALWMVRASLSTGSTDSTDGRSSAMLHCRLPAWVETAASIPAVLTLKVTPQRDIIAVPLVYVGLDAQGVNYIVRVAQGGTFVERPVTVGPTDGVRRIITDGLKVGETLQAISEQ